MWKERVERANCTGALKDVKYAQVFADSVEAAEKNPTGTIIGPPQAVAFHAAMKELSDAAGTPWENRITVQSAYHQIRWEPTAFIGQITIPTLYVVARKDEFTPFELHETAFAKLGGPKERIVLECMNLECFTTDENRGRLLDATVEFLTRIL
jgi:fermentation-respiration switch protein FrsA (DUF1100 family)